MEHSSERRGGSNTPVGVLESWQRKNKLDDAYAAAERALIVDGNDAVEQHMGKERETTLYGEPLDILTLGHDDFDNVTAAYQQEREARNAERKEYADAGIAAMEQEIIDASEYSRAASALVQVMQFHVDNHIDFQPHGDDGLMEEMRDMLTTICPRLDEDDCDFLLKKIQDFPPVTKKSVENSEA